MDRDKFIKHRFKAYEIVSYKNERMKNWDGGIGVEAECMVCAINYDEEIVLLQPLIPDRFTESEFYAHIKNVEFTKPKPKLSIVVKNNKKQ